jgi:hypothetical protein
MGEMFNRNAIGVRAHADGVGVKQANVSSKTAWEILHSRSFHRRIKRVFR